MCHDLPCLLRGRFVHPKQQSTGYLESSVLGRSTEHHIVLIDCFQEADGIMVYGPKVLQHTVTMNAISNVYSKDEPFHAESHLQVLQQSTDPYHRSHSTFARGKDAMWGYPSRERPASSPHHSSSAGSSCSPSLLVGSRLPRLDTNYLVCAIGGKVRYL